MKVLPVPPVISQLWAKLPDGKFDPASQSDCGEACLSSALIAIRDVELSPGCIRQALKLPESGGWSNGEQLADLSSRLGMTAHAQSVGWEVLWGDLGYLRHYGRYCLMLGDWLESGVGHWVLAYERSATEVHVMGPYDAILTSYTREWLQGHLLASQVLLS